MFDQHVNNYLSKQNIERILMQKQVTIFKYTTNNETYRIKIQVKKNLGGGMS
jgi:TusA-related sulfurtransferase